MKHVIDIGDGYYITAHQIAPQLIRVNIEHPNTGWQPWFDLQIPLNGKLRCRPQCPNVDAKWIKQTLRGVKTGIEVLDKWLGRKGK